MSEAARAFEEPHQRLSRLLQLGLDETVIFTIASRGLVARRSCTAFDPPSYPGTHQWATMHRASRELLSTRGWQPDDSHNFSRVVRRDGAVAVTIATGDDYTGRAKADGVPEPTTKYAKGPETGLAIVVNEQLPLWSDGTTEPALPVRPLRQTWWLLNAIIDQELRYELSCPLGMNDQGFIARWSERIIFAPIPLDALPNITDDDPGSPPIDVPVERL